MHDGPPYANGKIHVGHAVNKIIKDFIIKFKTLEGYNAPFIPGWDGYGLPIELNIEKKINKKNITAKEFRDICKKYVIEQINIQKNDFIKLGILADWENPYLTISNIYTANTIRSLSYFIKKNRLYYGFRPIHWCNKCESSLSDAEIEYKIKKTNSIYLSFRTNNESNNYLKKHFNIKIIYNTIIFPVWTTTAWTIFSNEAVAFNEKLQYSVIYDKIDKKIFVVQSNLLKNFLHDINIIKYDVIIKSLYFSKELAKKIFLLHPINNKIIPLINSSHVSNEEGTGFVHIAPAHGIEDFYLGKKYNLRNKSYINEAGILNIKNYNINMHIDNSEKQIFPLFKKNNTLLKIKNISHNYPYCWRHKKPLIMRVTSQWFLKMSTKDKNQYLDILKSVSLPKDQTLIKMIYNRPDWCISRQRYWGTPLTILVNKKDNTLHPNMYNILQKISKNIEKYGIEYWFNVKKEELLEKHDIDKYKKIYDTIDVWFDSGNSFNIKNSLKNIKYPFDLCIEGKDQYRGWFQTLLITSLIKENSTPFKKIITHGFIIDNNGKKLSKSQNNTISLDKILKSSGAEILRLWISSLDYTKDIYYSDKSLNNIKNIYRKIRNTARYLLGNLFDFTNLDIIPTKKLLLIDIWIINYSLKIQKKIIYFYKEYNFINVIKTLYNFCTNDMSAFYLEIIRDRQYTLKKNSHARRSAQTAIFHIINFFVRWISPILSFTSEEIWSYLNNHNNSSIFLENWYIPETASDVITKDFCNISRDIKKEIYQYLKNHNTFNIKSSMEIELDIFLHSDYIKEFLKYKEELHFLFVVSKVNIKNIINNDKNKIFTINIKKTSYKKCSRCWNFSILNNSQDNLCNRCIININSVIGEKRLFF